LNNGPAELSVVDHTHLKESPFVSLFSKEGLQSPPPLLKEVPAALCGEDSFSGNSLNL